MKIPDPWERLNLQFQLADIFSTLTQTPTSDPTNRIRVLLGSRCSLEAIKKTAQAGQWMDIVTTCQSTMRSVDRLLMAKDQRAHH